MNDAHLKTLTHSIRVNNKSCSMKTILSDLRTKQNLDCVRHISLYTVSARKTRKFDTANIPKPAIGHDSEPVTSTSYLILDLPDGSFPRSFSNEIVCHSSHVPSPSKYLYIPLHLQHPVTRTNHKVSPKLPANVIPFRQRDFCYLLHER